MSQNVSISSDQTEDSSNRSTNKECDVKHKNGHDGRTLNRLPPISNKPDSKKKKKKSKKHHKHHDITYNKENGSEGK